MEPTEEELYTQYILEGRTVKELMKMFNLSKTAMETRLRKAELTKHTDVPESFEAMYKQGLTYEQLAEHYGVEDSLIKSWRRRSGLRRHAVFKRNRA